MAGGRRPSRRRTSSADPREMVRTRRDLALDRQYLRDLPSFVRLTKTTTQIVGANNTSNIFWQASPYNVGGGADLANSAVVVPELLDGLWMVRCAVNLDGPSVTPDSNYRIDLLQNTTVVWFESNQPSANRPMTASAAYEILCSAGDVLQAQLTNATVGAGVTLLEGSHLVCRYLGGFSS